jgi:HK97 family phage prohead protease
MDIYIRGSVVADVNRRQRIIDVIAVPWNQESADPVPFADGAMVRERFLPGSFDEAAASPNRIPVNMGHDRAAVVGKVVELDTRHHPGLFARMKISTIQAGEDALTLADDGIVSPSIGYYTKTPSDYVLNRRAGTVHIRRAFLDHIALVGVPAYDGARVLAVRSASLTPHLDSFLNDPVLQWARRRTR